MTNSRQTTLADGCDIWRQDNLQQLFGSRKESIWEIGCRLGFLAFCEDGLGDINASDDALAFLLVGL